MKVARGTAVILALTQGQFDELLAAVETARASYEGIPEYAADERRLDKLGKLLEGQDRFVD